MFYEDYAEYKSHFAGFNIVGPTLFHFWQQGMSVEEAKEKLRSRGANNMQFQARGISDINLQFALGKDLALFCARMSAKRLTDSQKQFIANLLDRAMRFGRE